MDGRYNAIAESPKSNLLLHLDAFFLLCASLKPFSILWMDEVQKTKKQYSKRTHGGAKQPMTHHKTSLNLLIPCSVSTIQHTKLCQKSNPTSQTSWPMQPISLTWWFQLVNLQSTPSLWKNIETTAAITLITYPCSGWNLDSIQPASSRWEFQQFQLLTGKRMVLSRTCWGNWIRIHVPGSVLHKYIYIYFIMHNSLIYQYSVEHTTEDIYKAYFQTILLSIGLTIHVTLHLALRCIAILNVELHSAKGVCLMERL